ncbi:MAG TPA: hypothetical protein VGA62_10655, partial [Acidimicrobiia bacterium]
ALLDQHLLDLDGTYGDPNAGDPIQYDGRRIERDEGDVEIVVYNRAILLFTTDSKAVRPIPQKVQPVRGTWRHSMRQRCLIHRSPWSTSAPVSSVQTYSPDSAPMRSGLNTYGVTVER